MRHRITIEGDAFRLRPISHLDAKFVVDLRNDKALNKYLHKSSSSIEDQILWIYNYYDRYNDYYFVIERRKNGNPEGLISVYDIDFPSKCGEWGRWILRKNSLAAVESALLIYRVSFEFLGLKNVYCRTIATNEKVVSFHDSCGITSKHILKEHFNISGNKLDAIEHKVRQDEWKYIEPKLVKLSALIARRLDS
jgi:RimJ/RimL family protein N-acetyltransferase